MSAPPMVFEAGFTLGEQIDARAAHAEAADKVFLMHGDRRWTYRRGKSCWPGPGPAGT